MHRISTSLLSGSLLAALALTLVACGGGGSSPPPPAPGDPLTTLPNGGGSSTDPVGRYVGVMTNITDFFTLDVMEGNTAPVYIDSDLMMYVDEVDERVEIQLTDQGDGSYTGSWTDGDETYQMNGSMDLSHDGSTWRAAFEVSVDEGLDGDVDVTSSGEVVLHPQLDWSGLAGEWCALTLLDIDQVATGKMIPDEPVTIAIEGDGAMATGNMPVGMGFQFWDDNGTLRAQRYIDDDGVDTIFRLAIDETPSNDYLLVSLEVINAEGSIPTTDPDDWKEDPTFIDTHCIPNSRLASFAGTYSTTVSTQAAMTGPSPDYFDDEDLVGVDLTVELSTDGIMTVPEMEDERPFGLAMIDGDPVLVAPSIKYGDQWIDYTVVALNVDEGDAVSSKGEFHGYDFKDYDGIFTPTDFFDVEDWGSLEFGGAGGIGVLPWEDIYITILGSS